MYSPGAASTRGRTHGIFQGTHGSLARARPAAELSTKVVGRRVWRSGLEATAPLLDLSLALRGDKPFVPKGVYRFSSFEESDAWLLRMMTRPAKLARRG